MKFITDIISLLCLIALTPVFGIAQSTVTVDTLKLYSDKGMNTAYPQQETDIQSTRYFVQKKGDIREVQLWLTGKAAKEAGRVRIFGMEGGDPVPATMKDLIAPITFSKTKNGIEKVTVHLSSPVSVLRGSFFIAVDNMDKSVSLLSDYSYRNPICTSNTSTGDYYVHQLKSKSGRWFNVPFAYKMEVLIEHKDNDNDDVHMNPKIEFQIDTAAIPIDSRYVGKERSIAIGDINKDSYQDILVNNQLFINTNSGKAFKNISSELVLSPDAKSSFFVDINSDGQLDILQLQTGKGIGTIYINLGNTKFSKQEFTHPDLPALSTYSISYINTDRIPDIFVGQYGDNTKNYILLSEQSVGEYRYKVIDMPYDQTIARSSTKGANFVDINKDGRSELYVTYSNQNQNYLYTIIPTTGEGDYSITGKSYNSESAEFSSGCMWGDIENRGTFDVVQPHDPPYDFQVGGQDKSLILSSTKEKPFADNLFVGNRYSGGCLADINNDGLLDVVAATSCRCRNADFFMQSHSHEFSPAGNILAGVSGGSNDIVMADLNNDGTLDLPIIIDDSIYIYTNMSRNGNYVDIDISAKDGFSAIGSTVTVYSGTEMYTSQVISGRGQLVQDPVRLHYGLLDKKVDSAIVNWSGPVRSQEVYRTVEVNKITVLEKGKGMIFDPSKFTGFDFYAFPNPSAKDVHLSITSDKNTEGTFIITDLSGQVKRTLPVSLTVGESQITWDGLDSKSSPVSTGVYIITLKADGLTKFMRVEINR